MDTTGDPSAPRAGKLDFFLGVSVAIGFPGGETLTPRPALLLSHPGLGPAMEEFINVEFLNFFQNKMNFNLYFEHY